MFLSFRQSLSFAPSHSPTSDQPVDGQQYDRAQRCREDGSQAKSCSPGEAEQTKRKAAGEGASYTDQYCDYYAPGVRPWHDPFRQGAGYQPDHYQGYDRPNAYALSPPLPEPHPNRKYKQTTFITLLIAGFYPAISHYKRASR
jgi:hypothetical protein